MPVDSYNGVSTTALFWPELCQLCIPEEITIDAANSPHLADLSPHANNLDAHVGALLDDDVGVVGKLSGGGAGIVLNIRRDQLPGSLAIVDVETTIPPSRTTPYMSRDEQAQWPCLRKESVGIYGVGDGINLVESDVSRPVLTFENCGKSYHFAFKGSPDHGPVAHGKLGQTTSRQDAPLGDVECVHDGDDVVVASACSLDVLDQFCCHQLVHIAPKVRRVQRDAPLEVMEEEHVRTGGIMANNRAGMVSWKKVGEVRVGSSSEARIARSLDGRVAMTMDDGCRTRNRGRVLPGSSFLSSR